MPKRKKQSPEADEAPPLASATKKRKVLNAPVSRGQDGETPEHASARPSSRRRSPAVTAAAAAASGRAQSDVDSSASEWDDRQTEGEHAGTSAGVSEGGATTKHWRGVRQTKMKGRIKVGFRVRVKLPDRSMLEVGTYRSASLAARVYDRALIAMHGRKAAAALGLNFPLETYQKQRERQRYGPDLNAFLLQLRKAQDEEDEEDMEDGEEEAEARSRTAAEERHKLQALARANLRRETDGMPLREAAALVSWHRASGPLWCPPQKTCGVCPACRQPWRSDLGGCVRLAAGRAAGHREPAVVKLLASDAEYAQALKAQSELQAASGEPAAQQLVAEQQRQRQPQRRKGVRRAACAAGQPAESESELEWLEQPASGAAGMARLQKLQKEAHAALKQRLGAEEVRVAAALREEQRQGAPRLAAGAAPRGRGRSRRGDAAATPAAAVQAVSRGQGQREVDPLLLDPFTWLARAYPPHNHLSSRSQEPAELLRLAELCRAGGMEVPLSVEGADQLLEEEEQQREEQLLLLRQHRRRRRQAENSGEDGDGGAEGSRELDARGASPEAEGREGALCLLCGAAQHSRQGFKGCPVVQMALAVPKPPPVCPGCAQQEHPGCPQCLGPQARQRSRRALAQPFVRRAPWAEALPPATCRLMLAAQDVASAAAADLGAPQAAWRCTPKALLAVGLLAEEAARRELAARWPAGEGGAAAAVLPPAAGER